VRVGILKPDHLGDLILSAPAIAALRRRFPDAILFCNPRNLPLARHLFPGLRTCPFHLPHLDKERSAGPDGGQLVRLLRREIDTLICLRWDGESERLLTTPEIEYHTPGPSLIDRHVAVEQHELAARFTGPYDLLSTYAYAGCPPGPVRPSKPGAIGLCIAAGFRLNAWPLGHWQELAERLHRHGIRIVLIGGPAEAQKLRVLELALKQGLGYYPQVLVGTTDFAATLERMANLADLVIATDSGAGHLAALVRPVVSLFGGSPWRRFAPLGRHNLIMSRRYPCSPCPQFTRSTMNACHTQECLVNLKPRQVYNCLTAYLTGLDLTKDLELDGVWMAQAPWQEQLAGAASHSCVGLPPCPSASAA
jgi:ADP-heptose:LPS heptosyltransferase